MHSSLGPGADREWGGPEGNGERTKSERRGEGGGAFCPFRSWGRLHKTYEST